MESNKQELLKKLDKLEIKYCFNEQKYDNEKLKFIIVGDNPGKTEYEKNRFFIGPSGQELRKLFKENNLSDNFDEECIIFNKTFIHTAKTHELKPILAKIGQPLFDSILEYCAEEIANLANRIDLPILIFGKSNIDSLFYAFWKKLNLKINDKQNILLFNHPSPPYYHFRKEWNKYEKTLSYNSSLELLKKIGQINSEKIST